MPSPHEPTPSPRLWHPLGYFHTLWQEGGILFIGLVALMLIAVVAFLFIIFRGRVSLFFSLPFFLSLVPFIICSGISSLEFYLALGGLPPGSDVDSHADAIVRIQYPFQFGLVCSGALVAIYFCAYAFHRNTRNA